MNEKKSAESCEQKGRSPFPQELLFAVLCPDTRDYFLAPASEALGPNLVSRYTSRPIPLESRFIQYMPSDQLIFWDQAFLEEVLPIVQDTVKTTSIPTVSKGQAVSSEADFLRDLDEHISASRIALSGKGLPVELGKIAPQVVSDAFTTAEQNARFQYLSNYYAGHDVAFDVIAGHAVVFNVGQGGGLIFAANLTLLAAADQSAAERVALYAALLLEVVTLVGTLMGVKGNAQKCAEKIQEALKNTRVLQAIERLAQAVAARTKTIAEFVAELIKVLYNEGLFGAIISAYLVGVLSLVGILWLIASLLAKLVPGIGWAVTAATIIGLGAGIVVKIRKLFG